MELNTAYGIRGTTKDEATFIENSLHYDPMQFDVDVWHRVHVLQMWGTDDRVVPPGQNGQAWVEEFGPHAASVTIDERVGGDHSAANGSYHQVLTISTWIASKITSRFAPSLAS